MPCLYITVLACLVSMTCPVLYLKQGMRCLYMNSAPIIMLRGQRIADAQVRLRDFFMRQRYL